MPAAHPVMGAEAISLDVLFEDDHFLAVNKPPGLVVHPTFRHPDRDLDERAALAGAGVAGTRSGRRSSAGWIG